MRSLILVVAAVALSGVNSFAAETSIRVRVFDGAKTLTLRNAIPDGPGTHLGEVNWDLKCSAGKVHWKPHRPEAFEATSSERIFERAQIRFEHAEQGSSAGTTIESGKHSLKLPGTLEVLAQASECLVINTLPLQRYLEGVLAAEVGGAWPQAALEAQAVAAQSYTLSVQSESRSKHRLYDLESSTQDQVYSGMNKSSPSIRKAIEKTATWKLVEKSGTPSSHVARAYYHSTCGGSTDVPTAIWKGRAGQAPARICSTCEASPQFRWRLETSWQELTAKLRAAKILDPSQTLVGISPVETLKSGRHQKLRLEVREMQKAEPRSKLVGGLALRQAIGNEKLRSTRFAIEKPDVEHITFVGRGFGHGVGMCQWGAKGMAEAGKSSEEILNFYYPYLRLLR